MAQINKPSDYFNTVLYTGTGAIQSVTGVGFQPDWLWTKIRSDTGNHTVWDSVRGANASLQTSTTNAEGSSHIDSFDSDGFTLDAAIQNTSGETFVAWNWLAGGSASSNTDGSITSSVSANTTSGFSVGTYTSPSSASTAFTVGHGLNSAPKMYWVKTRDGAGGGWTVYNNNLGANKYLFLNTTAASATSTVAHNNTDPTTSVFSQNTGWSGTSRSYVFLAFAEIKGYSKIGSYTGNGSTDGTFVYTGFKPAWIMVKRTSGTDNWIMFDNKRDLNNDGTYQQLYPNTNGAEVTAATVGFDFFSNGFKPFETTNTTINGSGDTYIYMAFASSPLVGSNNIPTTAR